MKFFWRIASIIYTNLVLSGIITSKPPAFLFHKPNITLFCLCQEVILVDKNFTPKEQELIVEAVKNLEYFCNGLIQIILKFDLDPNDKDRINFHNVLLRVDATHPSIIRADKMIGNNTIGLCEYMDNDTCRLYLCIDRLTHPVSFRTTAIHELGHFIGLNHTPKPSIMYKHNCINVLYPTYKDAVEMARAWDMRPEDFRYFKL